MNRATTLFLGAVILAAAPVRAAGTIILSTWTHTDAATADWGEGTLNNVTIANNRLYLATNNTNVDNFTFDACNGLTPANWSGSNSGCEFCPACVSGEGYLSYPGFQLNILDKDGTVLFAGPTTIPPLDSWVQRSQILASYVGRWIKVQFYANVATFLTSDAFLCSGGAVTWTDIRHNDFTMIMDEVVGGRSTIYSGNYTSPAFDTGILVPAEWRPSNSTYAANGNSVTFQTQTSQDNVTWSSPAAWTPGQAPTSPWGRYVKYIVSFSIGAPAVGSSLPYVQNVTLCAGIPGQDIGLRAYDGTAIIRIPVEPAGLLTSPLRIAKNGVTYGIALVDPADPRASKLRVQTKSGTKALARFP